MIELSKNNLIVILYFIGCLFIWIIKRKKIKNIRDYGIGRKSYSNLVLAATILATDIGAASSIGVIQEIYLDF